MKITLEMKLILFSCLMFSLSCGANGPIIKGGGGYKKPGSYNFKMVAYDFNIDNPERDRRSYYKVFINKVEVGRTTIGLESQDKYFEAKLPLNRHLLMVQKWVLNERLGRYVKVNNIEQPKPNYVYFGIPEKRIVLIVLKNDAQRGRATFEIEFEH